MGLAIAAIGIALLTWNKTLGCATFNLPAGLSCPGRSVWCEQRCYACKGNFTYSNVKNSQSQRWLATQDLGLFIDAMVDEIARKGYKLVRIHSSGDFYSLDYFRAWLDIARQCPTVRFFTYTRTWRLAEYRSALSEAEELSNFTLWWSTDPTTDIPTDAPRTTFILDPQHGYYSREMPAPNCQKQNDGPHCAECMMCVDKNGCKAITFKRH